MIRIADSQWREVPAKVWKFPGGEVGVQVSGPLLDEHYYITMEFQSNDDLFALAQAADAIKWSRPHAKLSLIMPYIPYARQDRRCNPGEAWALKILAEFINNLEFFEVHVMDPHSQVSRHLINNLRVTEQYTLLSTTLEVEYDVFLAPDAGAAKKIYDLRQVMLDGAEVVCASKQRNELGQIIGFEIGPKCELSRKSVLVVDDICDGGATFVSVAEAIRYRGSAPSRLDLYVTHGIFSKGVDKLLELYDNIYVANLMNPAVKGQVKEI